VSGASLSNKRRPTRRERFLAEMKQVIPWATLEVLVESHCPQAEDMLYDSKSMRCFARIDLLYVTLPDERTLLLKAGTNVDATIICAPSSTENGLDPISWTPHSP
jgi:transposase, IS5 family